MRKNDCSPFLGFHVMPFLLIFQVSPENLCTPYKLVTIRDIFMKLYMNVISGQNNESRTFFSFHLFFRFLVLAL